MNKAKFQEKQIKYWARRNAELSKMVDTEADEVISNMRKAYSDAARHIDRQLAEWYQKFADDNDLSYHEAIKTLNKGELKDFKMTLDEYIAHGEQLDVDPSWLQAMKNASAKHHIDRLTALKITAQAELEEAVAKIDGSWIDKMTRDAYLRALHAAQMNVGVAFNAPNIDNVVRMARKPWTPDGMEFVERKGVNNAKLVQKVQRELTQAAITGEKYDSLAAKLSKDFALTQYESERIIRTESTHIQTEASIQAYKDCGIDRYQVLATLDKKTCELCASMDLTIWKVSDKQDGLNAPPFHPNCRCTTIAYFDDPELQGTRAAKNADGRTVFVDGNMSYDEWRETFAEPFDGGTGSPGPSAPAPKAPTGISQKEIDEALEYYVSGDGMYVNKYLRDPEGFTQIDMWTKNDEDYLRALDAGTTDDIKENVLYRSVDASAVFGDITEGEYEDLREYLLYGESAVPKYKVAEIEKRLDVDGKEIVEKGFMSTTKDKDIALEWGDFTGSEKPVILELKVPDGIKGADLARFDLEEDPQHEVLLARNQRYIIDQITKENGQIIIKATLQSGSVNAAIAPTASAIPAAPATPAAPAAKKITTRADAFQYFTDAGIPFKDGKKYQIDDQMIIGYANWHAEFSAKYPKFTEMAKNAKSALPIIEHVAPSRLKAGVLGQFEYYTNGKTAGIKINAGALAKYADAESRSKASKSSGWHSTDNPYHTFIHEYGHYVSHAMSENFQSGFEHDIIDQAINEFKANNPSYTYNTYIGLRDELSKYGTKSESECFAEAFAEYFGTDHPREFAKIFGQKVEQALKAVVI